MHDEHRELLLPAPVWPGYRTGDDTDATGSARQRGAHGGTPRSLRQSPMTFAPVETDPTCVAVDVVSVADLLQIVGAIVIPVFAVLLITRIARRYPAESLLREGRRAGGVRLARWGIGVSVVGVLSVVAALVMGSLSPELCDRNSGAVAVSGVVVAVIGALLAGGGSSYARRAGWMVLATVAALDIWIFYTNLLAIFTEEEGVEGLLLLAFAIHAACMAVAARWSFTA